MTSNLGPDSNESPHPPPDAAPAPRLPAPELRPFIKQYRLQEVDIDTRDRWAPAWTQTFILLHYGEIYHMKALKGPLIQGYPAMVAGIRTLPAIGTIPFVKMRTVAVELQPFAAYSWIGERVGEIVDGSLDASKFMPGAPGLLEEIALLPFEAKCQRLDEYFRPLFNNIEPFRHESLEKALSILTEPADQQSIESRVERAGLSSRHFRRLFKQVTGVSPKLYSRILRMERVLQDFHSNPDLNYLKKVHGFYDQSHFIREFKRFTNVTPRALIKAFHQQSVRQVHSNLESGPEDPNQNPEVQ